jgi:hypothetical protein
MAKQIVTHEFSSVSRKQKAMKSKIQADERSVARKRNHERQNRKKRPQVAANPVSRIATNYVKHTTVEEVRVKKWS